MRWGRLGCALAALLGGCTVGPDYRTPPILSGTAAPPELISGREPAFDGIAPLPPDWWRLYDDPLLAGLVEKALMRNTDLRMALASLQQAQAMLREMEVMRTPQTDFSGMAIYSGNKVNIDGKSITTPASFLYSLSEQISYDLDLFGKLKRSIEESKAQVDEAQAMLDLARVDVAAMTADAYSSACSAGLEIAVAKRSIAVAQRSLDVTQRRFEAGIAGSNDVVQQRQTLRQTEAMLPSLITKQRKALFMLTAMTGDAPENFPPEVATCASPPRLRQAIPIGDGTALLARRPDIRQAERKLAGAVADIGVSTAELYPSISLNGSASALKDNSSGTTLRVLSWSLGPMISWTFPNVSAARAKIAGSRAAARSALANFDGTVLSALRDTETALVTLARQLDEERKNRESRDDAALAYANSARKYAGGVGEFMDVLLAERSLIEAENSLASSTAQVSEDQIKLFMQLGGGWQNAPPVNDVPLDAVAQKRR